MDIIKNKIMAEYKCKKCGETKTLYKRTMVIMDGQIITKESKCKCGEYMDQIITDEYKGMPDVIRNENTGNL